MVHGNNGGSSATQLLNPFFGTTLTETTLAGASSAITLTTANTRRIALDQNRTVGISGIPIGGLSLYIDAGVPDSVAMLNAAGRAVYLGWDFFNAADPADNDPAWFGVLDRGCARARRRADRLAARRPLPDHDGPVAARQRRRPVWAAATLPEHRDPRVLDGDAAFLANNLWATLSGAQRAAFPRRLRGPRAKFPGVAGRSSARAT